jgi:hypothetical protein
LFLPRDRSSHGRFNPADIPWIVGGLHLTIATAFGLIETAQ